MDPFLITISFLSSFTINVFLEGIFNGVGLASNYIFCTATLNLAGLALTRSLASHHCCLSSFPRSCRHSYLSWPVDFWWAFMQITLCYSLMQHHQALSLTALYSGVTYAYINSVSHHWGIWRTQQWAFVYGSFFVSIFLCLL